MSSLKAYRDREVRNLVTLVESVSAGRPAAHLNHLYSMDELVRIRSGPFASFTGRVAEVDQDDSTLRSASTSCAASSPQAQVSRRGEDIGLSS